MRLDQRRRERVEVRALTFPDEEEARRTGAIEDLRSDVRGSGRSRVTAEEGERTNGRESSRSTRGHE